MDDTLHLVLQFEIDGFVERIRRIYGSRQLAQPNAHECECKRHAVYREVRGGRQIYLCWLHGR